MALLLPPPGFCIPEWNDDFSAFTPAPWITVTSDSGVTGKNASLATGGCVSGSVTIEGSDPAVPVAGCQVQLYNSADAWSYAVLTEADGTYCTYGLMPDDYRIYFKPPAGLSIGEWWDNSPKFAGATAFAVEEGVEVTGKSAALTTNGAISGTVTVDGTGVPISDCQVQVYNSAGIWSHSAYTDEEGDYSIVLPAGDYRLYFKPPAGLSIGEWWDNSPKYSGATHIILDVGEEETADTGLANAP